MPQAYARVCGRGSGWPNFQRQIGQRRIGQRAVQSGADRSVARICERSGSRCPKHTRGYAGVDRAGRISSVRSDNGGSGKELFNLALIDPLRVYVSVPEADAPSIRAGMRAWIGLAEFPASRFGGTVVRTANAIDQNTRTLLTEVDVPNKAGRLLPGAYAQVHFDVPVNGSRLSVPSSAMLFRSEGPSVAVVGPGDRVQLRSIAIGRDFGTSLEILQGIRANDRVVQNPPDSLENGQLVRVMVEKPS